MTLYNLLNNSIPTAFHYLVEVSDTELKDIVYDVLKNGQITIVMAKDTDIFQVIVDIIIQTFVKCQKTPLDKFNNKLSIKDIHGYDSLTKYIENRLAKIIYDYYDVQIEWSGPPLIEPEHHTHIRCLDPNYGSNRPLSTSISLKPDNSKCYQVKHNHKHITSK